MAYQLIDLVNVESLKSSLSKAKSYSEYYTDKKAFADIRFENSRLKFYTQEELDKEVKAEDATEENPAYAPVPAAIVDLPREQFLDELKFENSFNFATWNDNGDETTKIDAEDYAKLVVEVSEGKLSVTDTTTLKSAEKLVEEEFAWALGIPQGEVPAFIRKRLHIREEE